MLTDYFLSLITFDSLSALIPSQDYAFAIQQKNGIVLDRINQLAKEIVALLRLVLRFDLCLIRGQGREPFVWLRAGGYRWLILMGDACQWASYARWCDLVLIPDNAQGSSEFGRERTKSS